MITKCNVCGKEFYIRPADIKRGRGSCSRKCGYIRRKNITGIEHHNWKGNNVKYAGLHAYIKSHKPKPYNCECCGKEYKRLDLANISGKYKRDVNDFEWLCRKCHMTKDGRMIQAILNMKQGLITRYGIKS